MKNSILKLLLIFILTLLITSKSSAADAVITIKNNPAPGYLFLAPFGDFNSIICYDHALHTPYHSTFALNYTSLLYDVKQISNGNFVGYCAPLNFWLVFNHDFNLIDSVMLPNTFDNDFHDILYLPNGNYLVLGGKVDTVNMQSIVPGGKLNALVRDIVIIELTPANEIVSEWDAMNHLSITDATEDVDLTQSFINPFHINSIFLDSDNNIIASVRHQDQIIKINRTTGDIIWRMGGSKSRRNQFLFTNDTRNGFTGFSHQHDAQILSNGNLILFDNGNLKTNSESRVVEYQIDEANMTVTKVWEYYHSPAIYSTAMGSVQRLPNGNTLIGWGGKDGSQQPYIVTEVNSDKEITLEITGESGIYRAYKYPYKMDFVDRNVNQTGNLNFNDNAYTTGISMNIQQLQGSGKIIVEKHRYQPHNITFSENNACDILQYRWVINTKNLDSMSSTVKIDLSTITNVQNPSRLKIFFRNEENLGDFSQLSTSYNQSANQISATINHAGEMMIVYNDYAAPQPNQPADKMNNIPINPSFSWNVSKPGEVYSFQIALDSNYYEIIKDSNNIASTTIQIRNLRYNTKYYWRVKGISTNCTSKWSQNFTFKSTFDAPVLFYPNNYSKDLETIQTFKWTSVDDATSYKLQISKDPSFTNTEININLNNSFEYAYANLKGNTKYFWRVAAGNNNEFGIWSDVFVFQTKMSKVVLQYPENNEAGIKNGVKLVWESLDSSVLYNIQISTDNQFYNIIFDSSGISSTNIELRNLKFLTNYYWKVKAFNFESMGNWSDARCFRTTMPPPQLQSPSDGAQKQKLHGYLIWENVPEAEYYEIKLSTDSTFSDIRLTESSDRNSYSFKDLKYVTDYYWMVISRNKDGESDWSARYHFKTMNQEDLVSPDLIIPQNMSYKNDLSINLQWLSIENADFYMLEVSDNENFSNPFYQLNDLKDTNFAITDLNYNANYFWRVKTVKGQMISDWSDIWKFTTKLQSARLLLPVDNSTDTRSNTSFVWTSIDGAIYYDLELATGNDFNSSILKENLTDTTFSDIIIEPNTNYIWRIKGKNMDNQGDWSAPSQFRTSNYSTVIDASQQFVVYPNPVSQKLNINFTGRNFGYVNIVISDVHGRSLKELIFNLNTDELQIDVSDLSAGIYFIIVNTENYREYLRFSKY